MNKDINIAFITDRNYILPTVVAIRSLVRYASDEITYHVFLIADKDCQKIWQENYSLEYANNIAVTFVTPDVSVEQMSYEHLYVSKSALLKFCLPDLLSDLEKVLYIDGDVIIRSDLQELYNIDLEQLYACVVKDMLVYQGDHVEQLGLIDYFNSGVMLLNLELLREEDVRSKLFEYKKNEKNPRYMDQDAFNIVFGNRVKFVSPIYNFIYECNEKFNAEEIINFYELDTFDLEQVDIIHMAGTMKPWKSPKSKQYEEWISYIQELDEFSVCVQDYYVNGLIEAQDYCNIMNQKLRDFVDESNRHIADLVSRVAQLEHEKGLLQLESQQLHAEMNEKNNALQVYHQQVEQQINVCEQRITMLENAWSKRVVRKIKKILKI